MTPSNENSSSAVEVLWDALKRRILPFDLLVFVGTFLLTLVVHFYIFTNKLLNHDDVGGLLNDMSFALTSGRWFLHPASLLGGCYSSPWVNGLLGALFLALGCVFVVKLLRLRRPLAALLAAFTLVAFPSVCSTYTYMFTAFQYFLAMALAAGGAYAITRDGHLASGVGVLCVTLAMGIYQAYFCFAAVLILTVFALDLLEGRWEDDWKRGLKAGLAYVGALALAMVLYLVILKLCLTITGTHLVDYQGMNSMGQLSPAILLSRIKAACVHYWDFFRNQPVVFRSVFVPLSAACILTALGGVAVQVARRGLWKKPLNLALVVVCVLLFPLASGLAHLMTDEWVHLLMLYPMVVTLLFPAVVADRITLPNQAGKRRAALCLAGALLVLQLACGHECFIVTNRAYFYLDMTYENAYEYYTKLLTKVELQEGYTKATPVVLIGYRHMDTIYSALNMTGVMPGDAALNMYSWREFLYFYLGTYWPAPTQEETDRIAQTREFQEMPVYPDAGSIRTIDGIVVVKLYQY